MRKADQKRKTGSNNQPLTKENIMKADDNKNRHTGRQSIFTVIAAAFFIITFGLAAQPLMAKGKGFYGPDRSPDEIIQTLTDRLDLSAEQTEAIRPIIEEKALSMKNIRDKKGAYRKEARTEMHRLMLDTDMQLGRVLDDEQIDKYLELKQERRDQMRRGKSGGRHMRGQFSKTPEQEIEKLRTALDLTDEQTLQIEPIIKESIEKRRQVRQAMRNEMQAIGDETHEQLSTILTDEQVTKLNSMHQEKRARKERRMEHPGNMGF